MNLAHIEIDTLFEISSELVNVLVIEDEKLFANYCLDIFSQTNDESGEFILSEGDNALRFSKAAIIINDYFSMQINDKRILTKLYQNLQLTANEKFLVEFTRIKEQFISFLEKLNAESDLPLGYEDDIEVVSFFKLFGVKIDSDDKTLLEKIVSLLSAYSFLTTVKCVFFVGLKSFLCESDCRLLYREAQLLKISIFLLENSFKNKLDNEKVLIIDRDLCEISL